MSTTELIIVRHAESDWNAAGPLQGQADPVLSPLGLRQASALGQRLADEQFELIISSDLKRASHTAQSIAQSSGRGLVFAPGLRERHFGIFQGHTWEQVRALYPSEHEAYHRDPGQAVPGGESVAQCNARFLGCLEGIVDRHGGQRVVVVTHGGPLSGLFRYVMGLDPRAPRRYSLANAAVNVFTALDGRWTLQLWGDTRHLRGLDVSTER